MKTSIKFLLLLIAFAFNARAKVPLQIAVVYDKNMPQVQFAVQELQKACTKTGVQFLATPNPGTVTIKFILDRSLSSEAYQIVQQTNNIK